MISSGSTRARHELNAARNVDQFTVEIELGELKALTSGREEGAIEHGPAGGLGNVSARPLAPPDRTRKLFPRDPNGLASPGQLASSLRICP